MSLFKNKTQKDMDIGKRDNLFSLRHLSFHAAVESPLFHNNADVLIVPLLLRLPHS